jgi:hypothetical protein
MHRRELVALLGTAALSPLFGRELHAQLAVTGGAVAGALSPAQLALVTALADTILPKTDTPGAVAVGVPAFVDLLVAEWYGDDEKAALLAGLDGLDAKCRDATGKAFADLDPAGRLAFLTPVDEARAEKGSPEAAYRTLKQAIIYGWQTSRPIAEMNPTPIIPGRFDGCIPV